MSFVVRQPNGRLCRFSTIVDCITDYDMTEDDYINLCIERAKENARREAEDVINNHLMPYEKIDECFYPYNMTLEKHNEIKLDMEKPVTENTKMKST